jgi:hypothetical protein
VDQRVIENVRQRRGKLLDSQKEVGGWPELRAGRAVADAARDGISDAWEKTHGLNPQDSNDQRLDRDGDGYTNLEEYLNSLVQ